ncbi:protein rep [Salmonella enterica]|jgi:plasmid rolling circle replication initiator protein Rep|uniref:protein rep n=2 Tax=Salmonella enterica TaxID=28901 RepID=UPI00107A24B5|nr:protein rep [Salmonella enterica]EBP4160760.1 Replication protein [Salmonella enterica subsp. enterica]EDX4555208.1 Replication protein [Salmonella enterica subsp. enterica serovar Oranienburg]EGF6538189.1 protein rep [Escherichia coli]EHM5605972.1 protein rep [Salmonella enterica subsp. enterica serovar Urbana]EAA7344746.1 Replication protein [Salmonella enterica]
MSEDKFLSDYSPQDASWDTQRAFTDSVGGIYQTAAEFERYAQRMASCSGLLRFGWSTLIETGETRLRLRSAQFCRVRHCPVCQWRRTLMWQARFYQALPKIVVQFPSSRWLFLTLTVRNCAISELGETLTAMNAAFKRMEKRKELSPLQGWIRATEVTRGKDGSAHPHFHCLLMVPPSWFTRDYVKQARWVELWRDCLRVNYEPNVDIRTVKTKTGEAVANVAEQLQSAVAETLKYSVKPEDMANDPDWFLELTRQLHKRRFISTGGALKNVLQLDRETNEDLVIADEMGDGTDDGKRTAFVWDSGKRRYRRAPEKDKFDN